MASGNRGWDKEDDLPFYLARPGTADQVPRVKYGGMFCNVEGAYESKTIDFDSLTVGQRGGRMSNSARQGVNSQTPEKTGGNKEVESHGVEIKTSTGKELLQNLAEDKANCRDEDERDFMRRQF